MHKLISALVATIIAVGLVWKAEAGVMPRVVSFSPTETYLPLERVDCFLAPCMRPPEDLNLGPNRAELYNFYRRGYPPPYGWNYGHPPYGWNGYVTRQPPTGYRR